MKNVFLIFLAFYLSNNALAQRKKRPQWVDNYPQVETDYIGIASLKKSTANYKELAKLNALNALSNSISINVSVVSVLAQNETNKNFSEEFKEVTKTQTKNYIEGFDIVAEWEDRKNYWVYIKISKLKYQENKERKKNEVILQAYDLYKNGINHDGDNQIQLALLNYTRALSLLSPFLSESIVMHDHGKSIFLANEIVNQISKLFKELDIRTPKTSIKTFQASGLKNIQLNAFRGSSNLAYIPLKFESSDVKVVGNNHVTDKDGQFFFSTNPFEEKDKTNYLITIQVNFDALLREASSDNLIINLFSEINPNILNLKIENSNSRIDVEESDAFQILRQNQSITYSQVFENKNESEESLKSNNFETMLDAIKFKFPKDQIKIIAFNAAALPISPKQLATLISNISFDDDKIKVVTIYLPYLTSKPKDLYKLLSKELVFDNKKEELKRILELNP
jgi:hypothetical protein